TGRELERQVGEPLKRPHPVVTSEMGRGMAGPELICMSLGGPRGLPGRSGTDRRWRSVEQTFARAPARGLQLICISLGRPNEVRSGRAQLSSVARLRGGTNGLETPYNPRPNVGDGGLH